MTEKILAPSEDQLPEATRERLRRAREELDEAKRKELALKLEHGIALLIRMRPVSGFILTKMRRVMAPEQVPTMGVRPTADKQIQLSYNPFFVETLTDQELMSVLEHEVLHCINEHFIRRRSREHERWNISCDIAINQYIEGLPDGGLTLPEGLEPQREAEYYYQQQQIEDMAKQLQQQGGFSGDHTTRGCHDGWDSLDGDMETETIVREMVRQAMEEAKQYGRGDTPAWMEEMIQRLFNRPIKWQNLIRRNISEDISPNPEETYRKPHRRRQSPFPNSEIFPGHKRQPTGRLYVAFDTSGSISSNDLAEFLNEIAYLYRQYRDLTLIHCDADITKVEKYSGKNEIVCHGRGGTCFTPVLNYLRDGRVEGKAGDYPRIKHIEGCRNTLIYFTDGWGDNPSDDGYTKKFNTIWVICRNGSADRCAQFGKFIKMEEHRRG